VAQVCGMKKVLFIVGRYVGHIGRSLVIAGELRKHGIGSITFAGPTFGHGERIIPAEIPYLPIGLPDSEKVQFADQLEEVITTVDPDLICLDIEPYTWLSLVRFPQVPQVFITNWFLTHLGPLRTQQDIWFDKTGARRNETREHRGLPPLIHVRDLYMRDLVLCCDPPGLVAAGSRLPENLHIVGACNWEAAGATPKEIDAIDSCIVVSLGSSSKTPLPPAIAESIADAFDVHTIAWLGVNPEDSRVAGRGNHQHCRFPWMPLAEILGKARFCITQGGAGSTYSALVRGIPVGVWPSHRNHIVMAELVQQTGIGLRLDTAPAEALAALRELPMRERIRELVREDDDRGGERAARHIINMLLSA
jgi:UDP:flavonoid glycosyltransferase YjiC (YdhE family)